MSSEQISLGAAVDSAVVALCFLLTTLRLCRIHSATVLFGLNSSSGLALECFLISVVNTEPVLSRLSSKKGFQLAYLPSVSHRPCQVLQPTGSAHCLVGQEQGQGGGRIRSSWVNYCQLVIAQENAAWSMTSSLSTA